jgi:hypothetical protein
LAEFIVRENYIQHQSTVVPSDDFLSATGALAQEDYLIFEDSVFCAALKNSEIVGSVKITHWNEHISLPIQKLFNIDPVMFINMGFKSVWHIGRFAISKGEKEGAKLLRKLIAIAVYPVCEAGNGMMLAECDSKFVRVLNLIGLKTKTLAPGINYLGSETLPVYSTQEWLKSFLNKSSHYEDAVNFYRQIESKERLSANYIQYFPSALSFAG